MGFYLNKVPHCCSTRLLFLVNTKPNTQKKWVQFVENLPSLRKKSPPTPAEPMKRAEKVKVKREKRKKKNSNVRGNKFTNKATHLPSHVTAFLWLSTKLLHFYLHDFSTFGAQLRRNVINSMPIRTIL